MTAQAGSRLPEGLLKIVPEWECSCLGCLTAVRPRCPGSDHSLPRLYSRLPLPTPKLSYRHQEFYCCYGRQDYPSTELHDSWGRSG